MDESEANTGSEITNKIVKTLHKEHVNDVKSFPSLHEIVGAHERSDER
jgi:hypothetical protein